MSYLLSSVKLTLGSVSYTHLDVYKRQGGGCGALVCALTSLAASGTGVTGIFGILLCLAQPVQYAIMFAVAALVSFAVSFVLYKDESMTSEQA